MYQSPYFVEECKKKMSPISNWGFILCVEISDDRWALLGWELEDIRIAIEYHPYASTLTTYIDYRRIWGWDNKWITPPKKQRKF